MIDTLVLRTTAAVALPCSPGNTRDEFSFHGLTAEFLTTEPKSQFRKEGSRWMVQMLNPDSSIWIKGPVTEGTGHATFVPQWIRLNIPVLAGLPEGSLPNTDELLQQALSNVRSILHWMPWPWQQQRATIRELHLTMNFRLDSQEMLALHKSMGHRSVHADPHMKKKDHRTLYWEGTNLKILLYDKSREIADHMFRNSPELHSMALRNLGKVTRLEFCLKGPMVNNVFAKVLNDPLPVPQGLPPLPRSTQDEMDLLCVNARVLHAMFRRMLEGFPSGTKREIQRLTLPTVIAAGILQDWRMPDGTLLSDLYLQFAGHTKHASAKRLVHKLKLDFGGTQFSWLDIVPDDGWGAHAIPVLPPVL